MKGHNPGQPCVSARPKNRFHPANLRFNRTICPNSASAWVWQAARPNRLGMGLEPLLSGCQKRRGKADEFPVTA